MHATLTNDQTGQVKEVKIGFSWTFLFFGFWVPLLRGYWSVAIITLLVHLLDLIQPFGLVVVGFQLVFAFFLNKVYVNHLIANGYFPTSGHDRDVLLSKAYIAPTVRTSDLAR